MFAIIFETHFKPILEGLDGVDNKIERNIK
jgi:hypothetical protein